MRAAVLLLLPLALASAGCLREFEDPHTLRIVNVDLSPETVLSQDVVLNVTTVLDNRGGGDSDAIRIQAKAYSEETGFLVAENATDVGVVAADTTRGIPLFIQVPRGGSVRVDVVVFEDGQGKERASVTARNLGALEPEVLDTGLRVRDIDFLVAGVAEGGNGSRVQVQVDMYVTNEGAEPSEDLRMQVKARELSTSLVADVQWAQTGAVPAGATIIRSLNVTVPDGYNYVVEILTWRGDVVVARNEGAVQLAPTFVKPTNQEVVTTNPNVNDFLRGDVAATAPTYDEYARHDNAPAVPGFTGVAAVGAVALTAFLLARRRSA